MAQRGRKVEREVSELTTRVNSVASSANFLIAPPEYTGEGDDKRMVKKGVYSPRDYRYFELVEAKMHDLKAVQGAIADILVNGDYPLPHLVADINHGLYQRRKTQMGQGIDPSLTKGQREAIDSLRPLVANGIIALEIAVAGLQNVGMSAEAASEALA